MNSILLKIKRQFTHDEAIKFLQADLAKANFRNGELLSEIAELKHEIALQKAALQKAAIQKVEEKKKHHPTPDDKVLELRKGMETKGKRIKFLEEQVELWQNKYFNLFNQTNNH